MIFFLDYVHIASKVIGYWVILEILDIYKEYKKHKKWSRKILKTVIYDIITDFLISVFMYSIIYFCNISWIQILTIVIGIIILIVLILTKFSDKEIIIKGLLLFLAMSVINYF